MDASCGWGQWFRPRWIQVFASPKWFVVVYIAMAASKNGFDKYFRQTMTTVEKRFKLPSQVIGIIVSGNEVTMLLLCLTLAHYGGKGNRPLWISCGYTASVLSSLLLALPHLLYGPGEDALSLTEEYLNRELLNNMSVFSDGTSGVCSLTRASEVCDVEGGSGSKEYSTTVVVILLLAQMVFGVATAVQYTLVMTYLDDNSDKTQSFVLFNLGAFGPALSPIIYSSLASFCLKLYIDPFLTPVITNEDPRWLGAWWLGWIIMAGANAVICVLMSLFPKKMVSLKRHETVDLNQIENKCEDSEAMLKPTKLCCKYDDEFSESQTKNVSNGKDLLSTLRRILTNKLLMFSATSILLKSLVVMGKNTYVMKFAEVQYELTPSEVAMKIGAGRTPVRILGILFMAVVYAKFRPNTDAIFGWIVVVRLLQAAMFAMILLNGCSPSAFKGIDLLQERMSLADECSANCSCENLKYEPVCSVTENMTYFSPCHAGCTKVEFYNHMKHYINCSCLPTASGDGADVLLSGPCSVDCSYPLMMFIIAHYVFDFIQITTDASRKIIVLRCVAISDKSVAQAVILILSSIFAYIPGPVLLGCLIDYACLIWDNQCGLQGNCWVYSKDQFRNLFYGTLTGFTILGALADIKVWQLGRHMDFYKGEEGEEEKFNTIYKKHRELNVMTASREK